MSAWPGSLRFGGRDGEREKGRKRPGRGCSAEDAAAEAERRRRLEAFLAQKGRPRQAGSRTYLKDRTNGQGLAISRLGSVTTTERRETAPSKPKEPPLKRVVPKVPGPPATKKPPTAGSRFPHEPTVPSRKPPTQIHPEKPLRNDHNKERQKAEHGKENTGVGVTIVRPTWKRAVSGPAFGSRGSGCSAVKQPVLLGDGGALSALPRKVHPTPLCPPTLPGKGPPTHPRPTPTRGRSAASRSGAESKQGTFRQPPRTPKTKPRPPASAGHTASASGGRQSGRRGSPKPRQPVVGPDHELKTPSAPDRRKLLEEWMATRGKRYKRPPMRPAAPKPPKAKSGMDLFFWDPLEEKEEKEEEKKEEEERKEEEYLANEIMHILAECRKLAEEGLPAEQILAALTRIPQAERFAQFWVCKATLEARRGTLDVTGLYEAALSAGATPLQELRDAIAGILKHAGAPSKANPVPEEEEEDADPPRSPRSAKPCSAIKLQVLSLPRSIKRSPRPEVRLLTPVRRSLRIEGATASYPRMLRDHDPVVSSLEEIVAAEHGSWFLFRGNAALPGAVGASDFVAGRAGQGLGATPATSKASFPCCGFT